MNSNIDKKLFTEFFAFQKRIRIRTLCVQLGYEGIIDAFYYCTKTGLSHLLKPALAPMLLRERYDYGNEDIVSFSEDDLFDVSKSDLMALSPQAEKKLRIGMQRLVDHVVEPRVIRSRLFHDLSLVRGGLLVFTSNPPKVYVKLDITATHFQDWEILGSDIPGIN